MTPERQVWKMFPVHNALSQHFSAGRWGEHTVLYGPINRMGQDQSKVTRSEEDHGLKKLRNTALSSIITNTEDTKWNRESKHILPLGKKELRWVREGEHFWECPAGGLMERQEVLY